MLRSSSVKEEWWKLKRKVEVLQLGKEEKRILGRTKDFVLEHEKHVCRRCVKVKERFSGWER